MVSYSLVVEETGVQIRIQILAGISTEPHERFRLDPYPQKINADPKHWTWQGFVYWAPYHNKIREFLLIHSKHVLVTKLLLKKLKRSTKIIGSFKSFALKIIFLLFSCYRNCGMPAVGQFLGANRWTAEMGSTAQKLWKTVLIVLQFIAT
jgi:hypothetical protein